jgi:hypothetical protein
MFSGPQMPADDHDRRMAILGQQLAHAEAMLAWTNAQIQQARQPEAAFPRGPLASPPSTVDVAIATLVQQGAKQGPLLAMRDALIQQAGGMPFDQAQAHVRNVSNSPGIREVVWPQPPGPAPGSTEHIASQIVPTGGLSRAEPGQAVDLRSTMAQQPAHAYDGSNLKGFTPDDSAAQGIRNENASWNWTFPHDRKLSPT